MTEERSPMTHDEAILYVANEVGALDEERRAALQRHREGCPRCASLGEALTLLSSLQGKKGAPSTHAHPPSDALVRSVLDTGSLDPRTLGEIEMHLLVCAECAEDSDAVRVADRESRRSGASWLPPLHGRRGTFTIPLAAALAAVIILGIWGVVAGRRLRQATLRLQSSSQAAATLAAELARSRTELEEARLHVERLQVAGDMVRVFHLGGVRRGGTGAGPVIRLHPEDRFAILSVGLLPPAGGREFSGCRCAIYGDGRSLRWETLLNGSRVRQELAAADEVSLVVPVRALGAGALTLECRSEDHPAPEPLARLPFRVEAELPPGPALRVGAPHSPPPDATNPPQ